MNFWDSSCLLPLLVAEAGTAAAQRFLANNPVMVIWWGSPVECISALARKEREGVLSLEGMQAAIKRLEVLEANAVQVEPSEAVRKLAKKLLRRYILRSADAQQLAAALIMAGEDVERYTFVCDDQRLALAASKEGFRLETFSLPTPQ